MKLLLLTLFSVAGAGVPSLASAQYALAPGDEPHSHDSEWYRQAPKHSIVRIFTGPALRLAKDRTAGGLAAAIDIGARAAGGRLEASWMSLGDAGDASQYAAELWIDFGEGQELRPIVGAGASFVRLERPLPDSDELESVTMGAGVLRGTLQYQLPVRGTDARVALDASAFVPAIGGSGDLPGPWLTTTVGVGIGF